MRPYTWQEALALPYGIRADDPIDNYSQYDGTAMEQAWIQSQIAWRYSSFYIPQMFVKSVYVAMAAVVFVGMLRRLACHLTRESSRPLSGLIAMFDKHVTLAPTIGQKSSDPYFIIPHRFAGRWLTMQIPTRFHSLAILLFNAANVVILFTLYMNVTPNVYWPDLGWPIGAYLRYFSDRTGIIAFGYTPLVIALAARNNVIGNLAGASSATLQIYHRWIARWTYIHAFLHSIGFTVQFALQGWPYYRAKLATAPVIWGCIATAGGSVLVVGSWRRLREIAYECFIVGHIVGAAAWVVGCYYHVALQPNLESLRWVYAMIAVWAFDRLLRNIRLVWLNLLPRVRRSTPSTFRRPAPIHRRVLFPAKGQIVDAGDLVRIRITPARGWPACSGGPGTFVYISRPWHWLSWGSHPFTIAWPAGMPPTPPRTRRTIDAIDEGPAEEGDLDGQLGRPSDPTSFEVVMKRWDGFTRKLVKGSTRDEDAEKGQLSGRVANLSLCIEGPYGHPASFNHLEGAVLIAGGSGITAMLSRLADFAKAEVQGTLALKEIRLLWVIRDYHTRDVILPYLHALAAYFSTRPSDFLTLDLCVTGPLVPSSDAEKAEHRQITLSLRSTHHSDEKSSIAMVPSRSPDEEVDEEDDYDDAIESIASHNPTWSDDDLAPIAKTLHVPETIGCTVHHGRPDVGAYMDSFREGKPGRLGLAVCGPAGFCDGVKQAVRKRITGGKHDKGWVFAEELFSC